MDLLAADSEINGVRLSSSNCNSVNFGTPNTIVNKQGNISHILNIVSENFLENWGGLGWSKNGKIVGYNHNQSVLDKYYGSHTLNKDYDPGIGHRVESYVANIFTKEPNYEYVKLNLLWWWMRVHCPTDIQVTRDGETVASVVENVVSSQDSMIYIITNKYGQKDIIYPKDKGYQVVVAATDDGSMEVSSTLLGIDPPQSEASEPQTVDIINGQTYEMSAINGQPVLLDESVVSDISKVAPSKNIIDPADTNSSAKIELPSFGDIAAIAVSVVFVISIVIIQISRHRSRRR
ncbi:MAG: hypothetical protein LBU20_00845 [Candidatus Nomurabacteria bacterium]|jgi:hypothetical protein|nr:hypothetical protein [Candidatus Nomurabacteria bacterium]